MEVLFDFAPLEPRVQKHLVRVYSVMVGLLVAAAAGAVAQLWYEFVGIVAALLFLGLVIDVGATKGSSVPRWLATIGAAFLAGAFNGPVVYVTALVVEPEVIYCAFLCTVAVFLALTVATIKWGSRMYIYASGALLAVTFTQLGLLLMSAFLTLPAFSTHMLYLSLAAVFVFIVLDVQHIIADAKQNASPDVLSGALQLTLDFIILFRDLVRMFAEKRVGQPRRSAPKGVLTR